jgi:predicted acylesterase/phospholipase RssA
MEDYLNEYFTNFTQIERKMVISAADVEEGSYVEFKEDIGMENLGRIIRASSSIPFAFEPTPFEGRLLMDGGTIWNINLDGAI